MTENEIKEMLNGIINNGDKWECHGYDTSSGGYPLPWKPYKLGEAIHEDWEYRKVENWYVYESGDTYESRTYKTEPLPKSCEIYSHLFVGTKTECEKWIEEHAKKTWLEETLKEKRKSSIEYTCTELDMYELGCENGIVEVCKKILEEVYKKVVSVDFEIYITLDDLEQIIKDLGVEV